MGLDSTTEPILKAIIDRILLQGHGERQKYRGISKFVLLNSLLEFGAG